MALTSAGKKSEVAMLQERIEGKWIDCFARVFIKCNVEKGEAVAILSESQSSQLKKQAESVLKHHQESQTY